MSNSNTESLAYFDHNVLDYLTKSDSIGMSKLLKKHNITPVYSDENLNEIQRSRGFENEFLQVLRDMAAKYLKLILDHSFQQTGQAKVKDIDPFEAYSSYIDNKLHLPKNNFGLSAVLQKMHGGFENISFNEIIKNGIDELLQFVSSSIKDLNDIEGVTNEQKAEANYYAKALPRLLDGSCSELAYGLDKVKDLSHVRNFEEETEIGPKILNNIEGPNVLLKIWETIKKDLRKKAPDEDISLDNVFGIDQSGDLDRELTLAEKVNAIYHQLNYIGYYRDTDMKKERRFVASFSDMTHAGMASFCNLFFCGDERLVKKAEAAYEYLGIEMKIVFINNSKKSKQRKDGLA